MSSTKYRRGKHSVTLIHTHLVFVTKYRTKVFTSDHIDVITAICKEVARKMDFQVLEINGEGDHVHLLIEYPPKLSVTQIVNSLKVVSSRMLREKNLITPHNEHLWSHSYFAISCGGAPIEEIKKYIENPEKPSSERRGLRPNFLVKNNARELAGAIGQNRNNLVLL